MKKDDWAKLSSLAEIASSAAVLITLVYLSIQTAQLSEQNRQLTLETEQNTSAKLAARRQELVQMEVNYLRLTLEFPKMAIDNPVALIPDFNDDFDVFVATLQNDPYSRAAWDAYSTYVYPEFANQMNAALR